MDFGKEVRIRLGVYAGILCMGAILNMSYEFHSDQDLFNDGQKTAEAGWVFAFVGSLFILIFHVGMNKLNEMIANVGVGLIMFIGGVLLGIGGWIGYTVSYDDYEEYNIYVVLYYLFLMGVCFLVAFDCQGGGTVDGYQNLE